MKFLLFILLCGTVQAEDALALHPIQFSINGKPSKTRVFFKDESYDVLWNGRSLEMKVVSKWAPPIEPFTIKDVLLILFMISFLCGVPTIFYGAIAWIIWKILL